MTVVREDRKDLLAEIAKRAGERRAQVQNILERYAKEKDQSPPPLASPQLPSPPPRTVPNAGGSGTGTAARMAPSPAPPAAPAAASPASQGTRQWATAPNSAMSGVAEKIEKLDRHAAELVSKLDESLKRQTEAEKILGQQARRTDAMAKLIEENARRAERLEARVAELELRPGAVPESPNEELLAVIEARLGELDQREEQLETLARDVRRQDGEVRNLSDAGLRLEDRLRHLDRLDERLDQLERALRQQAGLDQRFAALEDAIARLTSQIDFSPRATAPQRAGAVEEIAAPMPDAAGAADRIASTIAAPAKGATAQEALAQPQVQALVPAAALTTPSTPVEAANVDAPAAAAPAASAATAPETTAIRPVPAGQPPVSAAPQTFTVGSRRAGSPSSLPERDQDKLKGVLDTLARLTAELHEMSEQRRFSAGA